MQGVSGRAGRRWLVVLTAVIATGVVVGVSGATVPAKDGSVTVCYQTMGNGQLSPAALMRVIDPNGPALTRSCRISEKQLVLTGPELPHNCADGQLATWAAATKKWGCGAASGQTYSAGTGLTLTGTTFAVDPAAVQTRVATGCTGSAAIQTIAQTGGVTCASPPTYSAGTGLGLTGSTFSVDPTKVQTRVAGGCSGGESIQAIAQDGSVTCAGGGTTYSAGSGLNLTGTTFSVDTSSVQSRVDGSCGSDQAIRSIASDGTVSCGDAGGGHVFAPAGTQVQATTPETTLITNGNVSIVGKCSPTSAAIAVRYAGGNGLNVISDGRHVSKNQTLAPGDLAIGTATSAAAFDRGEFDLLDTGNGKTLNGSFFVVFMTGSPPSCQFDTSALGH
jgi:hypothetical protein